MTSILCREHFGRRKPVNLSAGRRVGVWSSLGRAPRKGLFWFDQSAHMMQLEQPGKVLMHLVNDVRGIAAAAGDIAPDDRPGVDQD